MLIFISIKKLNFSHSNLNFSHSFFIKFFPCNTSFHATLACSPRQFKSIHRFLLQDMQFVLLVLHIPEYNLLNSRFFIFHIFYFIDNFIEFIICLISNSRQFLLNLGSNNKIIFNQIVSFLYHLMLLFRFKQVFYNFINYLLYHFHLKSFSHFRLAHFFSFILSISLLNKATIDAVCKNFRYFMI